MKKLFLSLVALLIGTTATFAQSSLLATLTHEGETTIFYGTTAFSQAMGAAADGDVITLSSGSFTAANITKAITLRGAGMAVDAATQSEPTILTGNFDVAFTLNMTGKLTIEGVYFSDDLTFNGATISGATFLKCRFKAIKYFNNTKVENLTMIHCKVAGSITTVDNSSVSLLNCIVWNPDIKGQWEFSNCVIKKDYVSNLSGTFKNSIFVGATNAYFSSAINLFNCLLIGDTSFNYFSNVNNTTNKLVGAYADVFKTCTSGNYSESETFKLTDAAATVYIGTDGSQIGIYGGSLPFDMRPSNPQITHSEVAPKSDASGNLKINITVQGAQ